MNHFWHRDQNHVDYLLKVFFFFTDCKMENSPHEYIAGTVQDKTFDGKLYYDDREIDLVYPENFERRIQSIVKAGTVVIEDTHGLHRAIIPKEGYRDFGYAVFFPQAFYEKWGKTFYTLNSSDYQRLYTYQKSFIPKPYVSDYT